jgi:DNA-binding protein YbaB
MSDKSNQLIETTQDFWANIQNPATRIKDPVLLFSLSLKAYSKFDDVYIRAAALCVLQHRAVESPEALEFPDDFVLLTEVDNVLNELQFDRSFQGLRWFLSLNLATASLMKKTNQIKLSIEHLERNIQKQDLSLTHGQPFTNVVKSAGAWIALMKIHKDILNPSDKVLLDILGSFRDCGPKITATYKFENEWAYEELSLVFANLYQINKCIYQFERSEVGSLIDSLDSFNLLVVPRVFRT